jgi:predicted RNA-binding protein
MSNCWIGVVSRSHVQSGVQGGFIQLNHGKQSAVQRLKAGDRLLMYSPRTSYPDGAPLQAFTAIGLVTTGEVYQTEVSPDFRPFRVAVQFFPCSEAPIKPLIDRLSFIRNKTHWGAAFRFGYVKVPESDFGVIADAMRLSLVQTAA